MTPSRRGASARVAVGAERAGAGAANAGLVLAIMFLGSLGLWAGVPLLALYAGSLAQGAGASLGLAVAVMVAVAAVAIALLVGLLGRLSARHDELRAERGEQFRSIALEATMAISAGAAVVGFGTWFLFLADRSQGLPIL